MKTSYAQYTGHGWLQVTEEEAESAGRMGIECYAMMKINHELGFAILEPGIDLGDLSIEEEELFENAEVSDDSIDEGWPDDAAHYAAQSMRDDECMQAAFAFVSQFAAMKS